MPQGAVVYLYGPPFQREADGYVWRQALYAEGYEDWPNHREGAVAGWAAVGADGQQYLTPAPVECPSGDPTIPTLVQMVDWERVACFGDRELTIRGVAVTGFGGYHPGVFEPYWLAGPFGFAGAIGNVEEFIFYHRPEGQTEYADGQRLRIIGHFMDGAAESCEMADGDPAVPEPRRLAILYCRERFVASSIEVIDG
jgi:hypothetical protein